jgi:hypothetical protein
MKNSNFKHFFKGNERRYVPMFKRKVSETNDSSVGNPDDLEEMMQRQEEEERIENEGIGNNVTHSVGDNVAMQRQTKKENLDVNKFSPFYYPKRCGIIDRISGQIVVEEFNSYSEAKATAIQMNSLEQIKTAVGI